MADFMGRSVRKSMFENGYVPIGSTLPLHWLNLAVPGANRCALPIFVLPQTEWRELKIFSSVVAQTVDWRFCDFRQSHHRTVVLPGFRPNSCPREALPVSNEVIADNEYNVSTESHGVDSDVKETDIIRDSYTNVSPRKFLNVHHGASNAVNNRLCLCFAVAVWLLFCRYYKKRDTRSRQRLKHPQNAHLAAVLVRDFMVRLPCQA